MKNADILISEIKKPKIIHNRIKVNVSWWHLNLIPSMITKCEKKGKMNFGRIKAFYAIIIQSENGECVYYFHVQESSFVRMQSCSKLMRRKTRDEKKEDDDEKRHRPVERTPKIIVTRSVNGPVTLSQRVLTAFVSICLFFYLFCFVFFLYININEVVSY